MAGLLIRGGRVVDPVARDRCSRRSASLRRHVIEIGEHLEPREASTSSTRQARSSRPGFVDMHVHLREPGFPEKETVATGTEAAVRGGFTASPACRTRIPRSTPQRRSTTCRNSSAAPRVAASIRSRRSRWGARDYSRATSRRSRAPARSPFSDDGDTVRDARVLREAAMLRARDRRRFHLALRRSELRERVRRAGDRRKRRRRARPARRDCDAEALAHRALSRRRRARAIRRSRESGTRVTCEVTPHHLILTSDDAARSGAGARGSIRRSAREADSAALRRAAVRRHHRRARDRSRAAYGARESGDEAAAAPGFSGLEDRARCLRAALDRICRCALRGAALDAIPRDSGDPGRQLRAGAPADVTIFADARMDRRSLALCL